MDKPMTPEEYDKFVGPPDVWVVVQQDGDGRITDLEVLDERPKWKAGENLPWHMHEHFFEANINGGDSRQIESGTGKGRKEE